MSKKKRGRPEGEPRERINIYVKEAVRRQIDAEIDAQKPSRGKVIESKFQKPC